MATSTEAADRHAARAALARYAAADYREARRGELALMAGIVGKPRPRPQPRPRLAGKPPRPSRGPGRWRALKPRPGEAARLVWVPARAVTASASAYRTAYQSGYRPAPGWDGPGMTADLSRTARF